MQKVSLRINQGENPARKNQAENAPQGFKLTVPPAFPLV
jgi:hypothetical protein